jgi:hypothetical protein
MAVSATHWKSQKLSSPADQAMGNWRSPSSAFESNRVARPGSGTSNDELVLLSERNNRLGVPPMAISARPERKIAAQGYTNSSP